MNLKSESRLLKLILISEAFKANKIYKDIELIKELNKNRDKAIDVGLATTGQTDQQKAGAWKNWGINTGISSLTSGLSIAASAAGGAVTGALGGATSVLGSFVGSITSTAINAVGSYGINMGANAIRYAAGDISQHDLGRSAMTGGISAGFNMLGGLASAGITSTGINAYGASAINNIIGAINNEASFWTSSVAGAAYDGMSGNNLTNYMSSQAQSRYSNAGYWSGIASNFGSSMVTTAVNQGFKKAGYENTFMTSLLNQGISRGFDLIGNAVTSGITGNWNNFANSAVNFADLGSAYNNAWMETLTSGMNKLGEKAGLDWRYNTDSGKTLQFRQAQWRAIANADPETKNKLLSDLMAKISIGDLEGEASAESTRNEWGRKQIKVDRDVFGNGEKSNLLAVIGAHEAMRDGYKLGDTLPNGKVVTSDMQDMEIIKAVLGQTTLANRLIDVFGNSALNEFKGTFVENNLKVLNNFGVMGLIGYAVNGYDNSKDYLNQKDKDRFNSMLNANDSNLSELRNLKQEYAKAVKEYSKYYGKGDDEETNKLAAKMSELGQKIKSCEEKDGKIRKELYDFMSWNDGDKDVMSVVKNTIKAMYGEQGDIVKGSVMPFEDTAKGVFVSGDTPLAMMINGFMTVINSARGEKTTIRKYDRGLDTNFIGRFLLFGNSESVDLNNVPDISFDLSAIEDNPTRGEGFAWDQETLTPKVEGVFNKSEVYKRAWELKEKKNISFSDALKMSYEIEKKTPKDLNNLKMDLTPKSPYAKGWMSNADSLAEFTNWILSSGSKAYKTTNVYLYTSDNANHEGNKMFGVVAPYSVLTPNGITVKYGVLDEQTLYSQYQRMLIDLIFESLKEKKWSLKDGYWR